MEAQIDPPPGHAGPQSVAEVLQTIQGVLSVDAGIRTACESSLRTWESDAAPGFLSSLMQIVEQSGAVDESIRLLATVVAKNAVGCSWRKTLGSREWSRVPPEEQAAVRNAALQLLLNDPSPRVAVQLSLLLANVARFDFPARAPDLLENLVQAATWPAGSTDPPSLMHLRALKALRQVLLALSTKRFVVESPKSSAQRIQPFLDLSSAAAAIATERAAYAVKLNQAAGPLTQLYLDHGQAFLAVQPYWEHHALAAKAAATCLADRLPLTPGVDKLPERAEELLSACHTTLARIMAGPPPGVLSPQQTDLWNELGGKLYERVCRVVIGHLDTHPLAFAQFVPAFLQLFVGGALLSADTAAIHRMRPKRRVLLVRFIAKALLSPFYRREWTDAPLPPIMPPAQREQILHSRQKAGEAQAALEALLGATPEHAAGGPAPSQSALMIEAVISKYIALTPDELQEWQDDPESYARSMEVESGPDAETPRPIGVGLLLCMLERGGEPVAKALVDLAARLQNTAGPEAALMREATYRCIGEGFSHVAPHIAFSSWYAAELEPMLQTRLPQVLSGKQPDGVIMSVLQARALWLVGVCSAELRPEEWGTAFQLASAHMGAVDLVVALTAVVSCLSMCAPLLDDQSLVESAEAAARRASGGAAGAAGASGLVAALQLGDRSPSGSQQLSGLEDEEQARLTLVKQRIETRLVAVSNAATASMQAAFGLLARLAEVESMVRVLQFVSVIVEVMDVRIQPQLPIIAAALPQIWEAAAQHASLAQTANGAANGLLAAADKKSADTGGVVRLHSALLAVLTHLVGKLKGGALANPQVVGVVYPLLRFSTSLGSQESECLVDEAFRLWSCTLSALPEVPPQLLELLPNLAALLKRGRDAPQTFPLVEAYMLLGAIPSVIPMLDLIQEAMIKCIHGVEKAALISVVGEGGAAAPGQPPAGPPGTGPGAPKPFSAESAAEALATSSLADVMLQLSPTEVPNLLGATFTAMVHFVCNPQLPALDCDTRLVNCLEGFLEVLGRVFLVHPPSFAALLSAGTQDVDTQTSLFMDKWLTIASHSYIEESLGVKTMAMLGRYRRRIATAALCALMASGVFPRAVLNSPSQITRVAALAVRAQMDETDFHSDQSELDNLDFKGDLAEDRVLARRLAVTRSDPVRSLKAHEAVRGLLLGLANALGNMEALLTILSSHASPRLAQHAAAIMSGNLGPLFEEAEEDVRGLSGPGDDDDDLENQGDGSKGLLAYVSD